MLAQETSRPPFASAATLVTAIPEANAMFPTAVADVADGTFDLAGQADLAWDPLLIAVAGYILTAVGQVHQLFSLLDVIPPAPMAGVVALFCYATYRERARRLHDVIVGPTKYLAAI